ncbi:MAG: hypothetical protein ACM3Y9_12345 [Ignavibacteria bacterium]
MGTLVAMKYPTTLFAKAADHTYVQCGTGGKAWGCWGGKTGGTAFKSGTGSTKRADCIAKPNERAGITCYLINGVCHQAANRILLPAGITVAGARGYAVSSAMFGTYGKVGTSWLPCYAPFDTCSGVSGDLQQCMGSTKLMMAPPPKSAAQPEGFAKHLQGVRQAYRKFEAGSRLDSMQFQMDLFERELRFRLGDSVSQKTAQGLRLAKEAIEIKHAHLAENFGSKNMSAVDFVKEFNKATLGFQDDIANAANKTQFKKFFELDPDERVILALPEGVAEAFGKDVAIAVYGKL